MRQDFLQLFVSVGAMALRQNATEFHGDKEIFTTSFSV